MRSSIRSALALVAAVILLPLSALTATAAVDNDTPLGATLVDLGVTVTQDTSSAETEALDAQLNAVCAAPAVLGSVWFSYDADDGTPFLIVDASASDYGVGLMVFEGTPSAETMVTCGPIQVGVPVVDGTTYYVMAFSDTANTVGGSLSLDFVAAPEAPTVELTVDPRGTVGKDGTVRLTGTYTCTGAQYSGIDGELVQRVGRLRITGNFFMSDLNCNGETQQWEGYATGYNGYFAGGKALSVALAYACDAYFFQCAEAYVEQNVQLSRSSKP